MNGHDPKADLQKQVTETSVSEQEFEQGQHKYQKKQRLPLCQEFCRNLGGFVLMLWDGLGFFGTDHFKLRRLTGEKVNFCTPFKSFKSVILFAIGLAITIYIIVTEVSKLGAQSAQTVSFVRSDYYEYHYSDAIPLHSANWFYFEEVVQHIRNQQLRRNSETEKDQAGQLREYRLLPEGIPFDELAYDDRKFIEEYFCNRTKMYYFQRNRYDAIGMEAYENQFFFHFRCSLLPFANDKIRIYFQMPVNDENYRAEFKNSLGRPEPKSENASTTIYYKRSSEFRAEIVCEFDPDLTGLSSFYALFHSAEGKNETKYNNWNFTTPTLWDSVEEGFWFATNTTKLVKTQTYVIGKQQPMNSIIRLLPETFNLKQQNVTRRFLIFPMVTKDIVSQQILWAPTQISDDDHLTGLRPEYNRSVIQSNIDFDFTERIYDLHYFGWMDILSKIGGLRASILPLFGYLLPLLTLHFLWTLAGIIESKIEQD